ncbi:hypothetical protein GRJ2_001607000 [Grus japonensis]|uniref:Uncharacterized protein n=1 Tax=Grus japonensis TaxID=30415 RepID=A0ABC9X1Y8_GRUJA
MRARGAAAVAVKAEPGAGRRAGAAAQSRVLVPQVLLVLLFIFLVALPEWILEEEKERVPEKSLSHPISALRSVLDEGADV